MTAGPIDPEDVVLREKKQFPDFVFDTFNSLIVREWDGQKSIVFHDEVMNSFAALGYSARKVYESKWTEVASAYEAAGWNVTYHSPALYAGEAYRAYYIFTKE